MPFRTENIFVMCVVIRVKRSIVTVDMHINQTSALHSRTNDIWSSAELKLHKKKAHEKNCTRAVQGVAVQSLGWVASFYFS